MKLRVKGLPNRPVLWACALRLLVATAVGLCVAPSAQGQEPSPTTGGKISPKLTEALATRGDLTLRNSSLEGALYTISELFGVNIVTGSLEGQVNGKFTDAPLHEILDGILLSNGYGYRPAGESLIISPLSEIGQVNPFFQSATIPVRAADVAEVLRGVETLRSPQGRVQAIESARTIIVIDFPERVEIIRNVIESIDRASMQAAGAGPTGLLGTPAPLEVVYFRTQFVPASSAAAALEVTLSKDGRIASLEAEDRLLVVDYAENVAMARRVLESVDRPRPQVRITAMIYDISVEDIEELGINWNQSLQDRINANGDPNTTLTVDSILKEPFTAGATGSTLTFMNLSRHIDITGVILALQNARDSRLLADPKVVVTENEEASFEAVQEIPFQQLTQTAGGGNIGTTSFKEAGIKLLVRPKIAADGTVELDVTPEFSSLSGFTPGDNQPIIDRRTATTTVRVANKQLVVIGGLRSRTDVGDFKGVPFLKDWKYVGKLFRARETTVRESELVVFVVPEIVGYAPPLDCRERYVADTIGCRLDGIPRAEGCVNGCCGACNCGCPDYSRAVISDHPVLPIPAEDVAPPSPGTPRNRETSAPMPVNEGPEIRFDVSWNSTTAEQLAAIGTLKRLPPVRTPEGETRASANQLADTSRSDARSSDLRPSFDSRYRSQKRAERVAEREPAGESEGGFLNRVFRR